MTASAHVMQLVRAHYKGDQHGFATAAMALARGSKAVTIRNAITDLVREGVAGQRRSGSAAPPPARTFQPAPIVLKTGGMLEELPRVAFDSLMLEPGLQLLLDELVVELEYRDELATRNLRARNRFLFHGPPGNGKTSSAAALATALDLPAYAVSLTKLIDKYVGGTGQNLGAIFENLTPNTIIVFDELDAVASHRGEADQAASKEFNSNVNTLLTLLDRNRSGVVIATTNRPDIIDPAVLRRFDEQLEFPGPTMQNLRNLAEKLASTYEIPPVHDVLIADCANYDAVAKVVEREARRLVMKEILAAEAAAETEDTEKGDDDGSEEEEIRQEAG